MWGEEFNIEVKHLKDMAAAAVFVLSACLVIITAVIILAKIFHI